MGTLHHVLFAGTNGRVFTLVTDSELKPFKSMLRQCDNNYVQPLFIPPMRLQQMTARYEVSGRLMMNPSHSHHCVSSFSWAHFLAIYVYHV